jgi:hypothetical protein
MQKIERVTENPNVDLSRADKLVGRVKDEYRECFRDFLKLLTRSRAWRRYFAERNKHRGEEVTERLMNAMQHCILLMTNDSSDRG